MDVLVVGGGIVGLSAAYYAADRGADVTLLEKRSLGSGSTARAAGGIRSQFSTRANVELSLASKAVWDEFEATFGVDIGLRKNGYLFLARTDPVAERFRENVRLQRNLGAESEYLTPAEATGHCPGIDPDPLVAATYNPDDGVADPNLAVQGYAAAARERGVNIRTGTTVTDVELEGNRIVGVDARTDVGRERHEADYVINAAGAWAGEIAAMAGIELPISPRRRQIAVVDPTPPVPESAPLTIDLETGSYFRPERDGLALVGGHFAGESDDPDAGSEAERPANSEADRRRANSKVDRRWGLETDPAVDPDRFDEEMDLEWAVDAVEHAADYAEYFGPETRIRRGWAGLYAVTPDHHPIIEETCPGLVTVAGFSGHGFQHAPAAGQVVAEILFEGKSALVDISMLDRDRFERGESLVERSVA